MDDMLDEAFAAEDEDKIAEGEIVNIISEAIGADPE